MKDEYRRAGADDVFAKLIPELALHARDADVNPSFIGGAIGPYVRHPFICERGVVVCGLEPYADIRAMCRGLLECDRHSFVDEGKGGERARCCRRHPVVSDGLLAAFSLGGPEAVVTGRLVPNRPQSYYPEVWEHWQRVLTAFTKAVCEYERSLLQASDEHIKVVHRSPHKYMEIPTMDAEVQRGLTLKIRPKSHQRKRV